VGYVHGSFPVSVVLFGPGVVKVVFLATGVHSLRPSCPQIFAPVSSEISDLFWVDVPK
jgi:hypothetical protein